jgi:RNA polymerase sigma factor (sigma-70 family)
MNEKFYREEKKLIKNCLAGNAAAQEKLFKKYYALMLGICLRYAKDRDGALEILQEGFIKIFGNLDKFKFEGSFQGWMKRIMVNSAIDKYRKNSAEPVSYDIEDHQNLGVKDDVFSNFEKEDLLNCIQELPEGYRTIFNMYVIEGFSHKEIAKELNISEGTSKSQLFKAKQLLKKIVVERFNLK